MSGSRRYVCVRSLAASVVGADAVMCSASMIVWRFREKGGW